MIGGSSKFVGRKSAASGEMFRKLSKLISATYELMLLKPSESLSPKMSLGSTNSCVGSRSDVPSAPWLSRVAIFSSRPSTIYQGIYLWGDQHCHQVDYSEVVKISRVELKL